MQEDKYIKHQWIYNTIAGAIEVLTCNGTVDPNSVHGVFGDYYEVCEKERTHEIVDFIKVNVQFLTTEEKQQLRKYLDSWIKQHKRTTDLWREIEEIPYLEFTYEELGL